MSYIKIYSQLTPQELRQHNFRQEYKKRNPSWDDSLVFLTRLTRAYLKKDTRVLDAGCGHGNFVIDELKPLIKEAIGVDLSPENTSKNICLDKIVYSPLEKLPFKKNSFDLVISLWVIEHLRNPKKVFHEVYRVLKPQGVFIFATPNKESYLIFFKRLLPSRLSAHLIKRFYGREEKDCFPAFYKVNKPQKIEDFLHEVGFSQVKIRLNGDPTYLALNRLLFEIGVFLETAAARFLPEKLIKVHILGVAIK